LDEAGNIASYGQLPVQAVAEGPIQIAGPSLMTAEGGMTGLYLKTTGERGPARLTLTSPGLESLSLDFIVS
ncbi:MAG: hypothetical protein J6H18_00980, partial [Lachnospiraceae bacterium]|nr:hypothetical protein [Lachnospiraceae bacterium]